MEFKIKQSVLKEALATVQGALEKKSTIPVLSNVLIESAEDAVRITATDMDVTIRTMAAAGIVKGGSMCILARKLIDLVRNLPDTDLTLTLQPNMWAKMSVGRSVFKFAGVNTDNYPEPVINNSRPVTIAADTLSRMIGQTVFAAAKPGFSRHNIQGVKISLADGRFVMAATDGYRLTEATCEMDGEPGVEAVIPTKALLQVSQMSGDEVDLGVDRGHAFFTCGGTEICVRTLLAPFPNYRVMMPSDPRMRFTVDAEEFRAIVRRAATMGDDRNQSFRMLLSDDVVRVSAQGVDASEGLEILETDYQGEERCFGFQWVLLMDFLNATSEAKKLTFDFDAKGENSIVEIIAEGMEGYRFVTVPIDISVTENRKRAEQERAEAAANV